MGRLIGRPARIGEAVPPDPVSNPFRLKMTRKSLGPALRRPSYTVAWAASVRANFRMWRNSAETPASAVDPELAVWNRSGSRQVRSFQQGAQKCPLFGFGFSSICRDATIRCLQPTTEVKAVSTANQKTYDCLTAGIQVIISAQTYHGISGIGDEGQRAQTDYACSEDDNCQHRTTLDCRVRKLNR